MMNRLSILLACLFFLPLMSDSQTIVESRSGKFSVRIEQAGSAKTWPESNQWTATVMNEEGNRLYQIQKEVPFDFQFPAIILSDLDGSSVVVSSAEGVIEWYGPGGESVAALYPFGNHAPDYERVIKCAVNGGVAAFLFSSPESREVTLSCMTMKGEKLWSSSLPHEHAAEVVVSSSGKYVMAGSYSSENGIVKKTYVFDGKAEMIRELAGIFRHGDIDEKNKRVAFAERNDVTIADITKQTTTSWTTGRRELIATNVQILGDYVLATIEDVSVDGGVIRYHNPAFILIDGNGTVTARRDFQSAAKSPVNMKVRGDEVIATIGGVQQVMDFSKNIRER